MRIERSLLLLLVLTFFGMHASAQDQERSKDPALEAEPEAVAGDVRPEAGAAGSTAGGGKGSGPPTRFIPRETISPDSVIAFPADI
jgi:hypothetical protein